jgi:hypothetical protein
MNAYNTNNGFQAARTSTSYILAPMSKTQL